MIAFLQPLLAALIGLGMLLYGILHTVTGFPPAEVFTAFWNALPQVISLLVFLLGVLAVVAGLVLLVMGVRGVHRRLLELRHMYGRRQGYGYDDRDAYGEVGYR